MHETMRCDDTITVMGDSEEWLAPVTLKQNKLLTKTDLMFDKVFVPPRIVQRCFTTFRTTSVTIPAICHSVLESLREIEIYKGSDCWVFKQMEIGNVCHK